MKFFSKVLYVLLGVIMLGCVVILLCARNPALANGISNFSEKLSKDNTPSAISTDDNSQVDIEALLQEIELRDREKKSASDRTIDLGLASPLVFDSLDEYYEALAGVIRDNYNSSSVLIFQLRISDDLFQDWYDANYAGQNSTSGNAFSFSVDYEKEDTDYLINHTVNFE